MKSKDHYIDQYIMLCSQLCKRAEDYTRQKVVRHNKAVDKLEKLKKAMYEDMSLTEKVYETLLNSEDAYVQQSAASDCLLLNIHIGTSVKILKHICRYGDRMSAMGAERTLLVWEGKLNPTDPF